MDSNSSYSEIRPKSSHLKQFIKLYYVQRSEDKGLSEKITYFPNYVTTINVYEHSKVAKTLYSRTHTYDESERFQILLVSKFDRSREIIMRGAFNKLSIVFNPLGINHFLDKPLSNYTEENFSFFHLWGVPFEQLLEKVFSEENIEKKRDLLDTFFESIYIGFKEDRLSYAVNKILDSQGQISIQQIAGELKVSRKTLLRLFQKHLAYAPSAYRSIIKFRKALDFYQGKIKKPKLSMLAYESYYYDQADLNFHFKAKTGLTPQQLFSKIQTIEQGLYWKLDSVK